MKFLLTGDWHIRERNSRSRTNVVAAVFHKVEHILQRATEEEVDAILQPGDFFDTSKPSWSLFGGVVSLLEKYEVGKRFQILTIPGQHDQENHLADIKNTPIGLLERLGYVKIPTATPITMGNYKVYGAGWGADIPTPVLRATKQPPKTILLTHRMVIDEKLWNKQEDFDRANILLRHHDFDLFVCGDNHNYHTAKLAGRYLVNCGSLVRTNIDQINHEPTIFFYEDVPEPELIPVLGFAESETAKPLAKSEELNDLIGKLKKTRTDKVSFKDKFLQACKKGLSERGHELLKNEILI